ncbi:hypothetical protein MN202_14330 [Rheinheimera muenzenbergensis]|uniref:Uncharacterized protein n=1 Tax=Rheinheimera muenzenbergensis TaxID=1193628 RepID=A0ABU8C8Y3_9GAMM
MKIRVLLLLGIILAGAVSAVFYFTSEHRQDGDNSALQTQAVELKDDSLKHKSRESTAKISETKMSSRNAADQQSESETNNDHRADPEPFYSKLTTESEINSYFIRNDDAIYEKTLVSSFQTQDFNQFIMSLDSIAKDYTAIENEQQLSNYLLQHYGSRINNEIYSCAGRICAVSFNYASNRDTESFKTLNEAGSYFSFYSTSLDEHGNPVMKAILITTEAAESLTIAR